MFVMLICSEDGEHSTTTIHETDALRNRPHVFPNRSAAGEVLGDMLASRYANASDIIVLAMLRNSTGGPPEDGGH